MDIPVPESENGRKQPNVMIITSHDSGRHFGCYGIETVHTPSIDRLAASGHRFSNFFTVSPVCSPSRGAFMTGRYPQSNGLMGLTHEPWEWTLNPGERHLSRIMRDAGYHTALFGIQHESPDVTTLGFVDFDNANRPGATRLNAIDLGEAVGSFLMHRSNQDSPFFAQIGFFESHIPFDFGGATPDSETGITVPPYIQNNDAARSYLAAMQGAIRRLDDGIGRILRALDESGLADNTIVIFTTDHGIEVPRAKHFLFDAGIATSLLMRWPAAGIDGGKIQDRLTSNIDVLPTLLELIGVPIPDNIEGKSFTSLFDPSSDSHPRDEIFAMYQTLAPHLSSENRCIRTNRYKLIRNFVPRRQLETPVDIANPVMKVKLPVVELYDLEKDPLELENLAEQPDHQEIRQELSNRLWHWLEEVRDPILHGPVPTPYFRQAIADYVSAGSTAL
jgi:arylsulfatase A-like enzyme